MTHFDSRYEAKQTGSASFTAPDVTQKILSQLLRSTARARLYV